MKESNILADNVVNNLLNMLILKTIQEKFMKESNILVDNVAKNLLHRDLSQIT